MGQCCTSPNVPSTPAVNLTWNGACASGNWQLNFSSDDHCKRRSDSGLLAEADYASGSAYASGSGVTVQGVHASDLGVTLAFLKDFAAEHIEEVVRQRLTTGAVNRTLILPVTRGSSGSATEGNKVPQGPSYAELGHRAGRTDSQKCAAMGKATVFVAQSWDNPFESLVEALEAWIEESGTSQDQTYFWLDLFSVPPGHAGWSMPESWWSDRYTKTIGTIGTTVVVAEPWHSPATFVGAWSIWQLYCTTVTGARLHLAMGPEQRRVFMRQLTRSFEEVRSALCEVKVDFHSAAEKDVPEGDRHHIIDEIQRVVSFERLNEVLQTRLRHWLAQCAKEELHKVVMQYKTEPRGGAETWRQLSPDELSLRDHVGQLLREMGNLGEAEAYFRKLRADCELRLGADSAFTLAVMNQLAITLQKSRDAAKRLEAERLHRDLLQRREDATGLDSPITLQSASNVAVVLIKQWRAGAQNVLPEARRLCERALAGRRGLLGPEDPRTLYTACSLAIVLSAQLQAGQASEADVQKAEALYEEATRGLSKRLGAGHQLALRALQYRAEHLLYRSDREKSVELCRQALQQLTEILAKQTVKLGREHDETQQTKELTHRARVLLATLERSDDAGEGAGLPGRSLGYGQEARPWREWQPEVFQVLNTAEHFQWARRALREYGLHRLLQQLQELGFVDGQEMLTTSTKPFNVFARIGAGVMKQDSMVSDQLLIGKHQDRFTVACNRPECDDNWESADPAWLGKASMAKHHRFLITKDLHWKWFNVLVFGMFNNLVQSIQFLEAMEEAATMYVKTKPGWPSRVGMFFHVYALSSVNSLHLHIVDLDNTGPTYKKMEHKNLSLVDVLTVLRQELKESL